MTAVASRGQVTSVASPHRPFLPVHPGIVIGVGVLVGIVTYLVSRAAIEQWPAPRWAHVNTLSREPVLLYGPVLAGIAAWIAGWRHTAAIGPLIARGSLRVAAAHLTPVSVAVLFGQTAGIVPAVLAARRAATVGGLSPALLIGGFLSAVVMVVFGYALGTLFRSRLVPIVASALTYPLLLAPQFLTEASTGSLETGRPGRSFYSVAIVYSGLQPQVGQEEVPSTAVVRLVLLAAWIAAGLMVLQGRPTRRSIGLAVAVPLLISGALIARQPILLRDVPNTCVTSLDTRLCVPADTEGVLPSLREGAEAITTRFGYGAMTVAGVPDSADLSTQATFWLGATDATESRDQAVLATARAVAGIGACLGGSSGNPDSRTDVDAAQALIGEMATRAGISAEVVAEEVGQPLLTAKVARKNDAEIRELLTSNAAAFAACNALPVVLAL